MKPWAKALYQSTSWKATREAYASSKHFLCERCSKPGGIVHHKDHLTRDNISNPSVALSWDNLELVCRECHGLEHEGVQPTETGLRFDEHGDLIERIAPHSENGIEQV